MLENLTVTEQNKDWIVESLRAIAEIVIWGDQNDPAVFEFFMEKDILRLFEHMLLSDGGRGINVQVLQTLSILFENISNKPSLCTEFLACIG
jgi:protein CLEC16A